MTEPAARVQIGWLGRPVDDPEVATLVVLHGYGANEADLLGLLPVLEQSLPDVTVKVLAVRGFFPCAEVSTGFSWFPGPVLAEPVGPAIAETADRLGDLVRQHSARATWLGFSQGMAAAVAVLRRRPEVVQGLIGLSGFTFSTAQPADVELLRAAGAGRGVPAFYGRDPADPIVPGTVSGWTGEFLRRHTALTEHTYPGTGHGVSLPEIADLAAFLRQLLASGSAAPARRTDDREPDQLQ